MSEKRKRHMFTLQEDVMLCKLVMMYGTSQWSVVASHIEGRSARQCRERWKTFLSPGHVNGPWTKEEDSLLFKLYEQIGPKWAAMMRYFVGRSDYNIKNRWYKLTRLPAGKEPPDERQPLPEPYVGETNREEEVEIAGLSVDDVIPWTF